MKNLLLVVVAALGLGCPGPEPEVRADVPAQFRLSVPPASQVVPGCPNPTVRLYRDGSLFGCSVATSRALDGGDEQTVIVCLENKELKAATRYQFEVVYLQGSTVVARGPVDVNGLVLSPGMNALELPTANVTTTLDANSNGMNDVREACP